MIQPSPAARTPKRTPSKPVPNSKRQSSIPGENARADAELARRLTERAAVGKVIRSVALNMAEEIQEKFHVLSGFLRAADGEEQLGLHELRSGCIKFRDDFEKLQMSIFETKVRGEAGHAD
jgi:hypothetical protein